MVHRKGFFFGGQKPKQERVAVPPEKTGFTLEKKKTLTETKEKPTEFRRERAKPGALKNTG